MKKTNFIFIVLTALCLILSCSSSFHNQYYQKIKGAWTINHFEHIDKIQNKELDLRREEGFYIVGLEKHNHIWFTKRENRQDKSIDATYDIFKQNDTLKLRITKSDDERLEGVYDLYIDTIAELDRQYKVQIALDSENTYLSALRVKN
ncbi:hypothetical protein SAMN04488096_10436 [Mesonia phycicola]|uniref:Lipocalin-like domain-containing protein n=1 Tax=Mesonia phycicola TaxID=579105 RepID=A0A1M6DJZ5_9FLAO|nr:hypothetical protein [Mesonia phycicola]SHI73490.1 hypothetical protein SAMN04488096_10436 [Mesonia phycicola]